ncbi:MMPL family transporter [Streptomyces sp. ISL-98]|uniref:MMPL family transporter n=1 Tax=Streptomyces sp. ISL-98 TaxID=2819192 RepID=UPI001BE7E196|nr:MMPL family transporter [Streptomyces sp. ISL-98]MBT2511714.1 MMPL family transporter [Streptomyces sp. ISL-98]
MAYNRINSCQPVVLQGFNPGAHPAELGAYARRLSAYPGVAQVETTTGTYNNGQRSTPATASAARFAAVRAVWLAVTPHGDPQDPAQADLIARLRATPAPRPASVMVGGPAARLVDVRQPLVDRLAWALTFIATTALLVVLAVTRRPVLAIKAITMNALSLTATFGALVFVFQEGHSTWLLGGYSATGTTDLTAPIMIFCMAFGLSMDYEILLLSRMLEEHSQTGDTRTAVVRGLDRSARLFTWPP